MGNYEGSFNGGLEMSLSDVIWMLFVLVLTFIILYQDRQIRRLKSLGGSKSSTSKNETPNNLGSWNCLKSNY